ncbi:hypothetical protein PPERSA_08590 [Pseudocohnilembus persalinus]|uniref:Transmembrane protein n=1 Tax=Pseudocohnilembus persalinus TaxID=266149 RepID=A0A0V0R1I0_PSEPJ|nr:hypothetical protein PPERSA_08590 [Pseudocohnilembus persalinus]|eukprot:KRX08391.1 hypothetical protein PPERSA_08590 [Pseudocohnilembus persalinus]
MSGSDSTDKIQKQTKKNELCEKLEKESDQKKQSNADLKRFIGDLQHEVNKYDLQNIKDIFQQKRQEKSSKIQIFKLIDKFNFLDLFKNLQWQNVYIYPEEHSYDFHYHSVFQTSVSLIFEISGQQAMPKTLNNQIQSENSKDQRVFHKDYLKLFVTGYNPSEIKIEVLTRKIDLDFESSKEKKYIEYVNSLTLKDDKSNQYKYRVNQDCNFKQISQISYKQMLYDIDNNNEYHILDRVCKVMSKEYKESGNEQILKLFEKLKTQKHYLNPFLLSNQYLLLKDQEIVELFGEHTPHNYNEKLKLIPSNEYLRDPLINYMLKDVFTQEITYEQVQYLRFKFENLEPILVNESNNQKNIQYFKAILKNQGSSFIFNLEPNSKDRHKNEKYPNPKNEKNEKVDIEFIICHIGDGNYQFYFREKNQYLQDKFEYRLININMLFCTTHYERTSTYGNYVIPQYRPIFFDSYSPELFTFQLLQAGNNGEFFIFNPYYQRFLQRPAQLRIQPFIELFAESLLSFYLSVHTIATNFSEDKSTNFVFYISSFFSLVSITRGLLKFKIQIFHGDFDYELLGKWRYLPGEESLSATLLAALCIFIYLFLYSFSWGISIALYGFEPFAYFALIILFISVIFILYQFIFDLKFQSQSIPRKILAIAINSLGMIISTCLGGYMDLFIFITGNDKITNTARGGTGEDISKTYCFQFHLIFFGPFIRLLLSMGYLAVPLYYCLDIEYQLVYVLVPALHFLYCFIYCAYYCYMLNDISKKTKFDNQQLTGWETVLRKIMINNW